MDTPNYSYGFVILCVFYVNKQSSFPIPPSFIFNFSFVVVFCYWKLILEYELRGLAFILLYISHMILTLLLISFYKAIFSDPGKITKQMSDEYRMKKNMVAEFEESKLAEDSIVEPQESFSEIINNTNLFSFSTVIARKIAEIHTLVKNELEDNTTGNQQPNCYNYCPKCKPAIFRPPRARHCRICGSCVLRFDHHCPLINNCVGFKNYKFFLLSIFYIVALLVFGEVTVLACCYYYFPTLFADAVRFSHTHFF